MKRTTVLSLVLALLLIALPGSALANSSGSARHELTSLSTDLHALLSSPDEEVAERAEKALDKLADATQDKYWADENHLAKDGNKAIDKLKDVVKELEHVIYDARAAAALAAVVVVSERLALTELSDAIARNGEADEIRKAQEDLAKAELELAKGDFEDAIDKYKKAWEHAFKAEAEIVDPAISVDVQVVGSGSGSWAEYTFRLWNLDTQSMIVVWGSNQEGTYGYTGASNEGYLQVGDDLLQFHVSCSDAFTDGIGQKSDPAESSPWRVVDADIVKVKDGEIDKVCHLVGMPDPEPTHDPVWSV